MASLDGTISRSSSLCVCECMLSNAIYTVNTFVYGATCSHVSLCLCLPESTVYVRRHRRCVRLVQHDRTLCTTYCVSVFLDSVARKPLACTNVFSRVCARPFFFISSFCVFVDLFFVCVNALTPDSTFIVDSIEADISNVMRGKTE